MMKIVYLAVVFFFILSSSVLANDDIYQLKAAYLYQFIKHVNWPENKPRKTIAVIANIEEAKEIMDSSAKIFNDKDYTMILVSTIEEVAACCDIFYFSQGTEHELESWSAQIPKGSLTVADDRLLNGYLAMIQLKKQRTKLKFYVHNTIAKEQDVFFSSRLFRVALKVD